MQSEVAAEFLTVGMRRATRQATPGPPQHQLPWAASDRQSPSLVLEPGSGSGFVLSWAAGESCRLTTTESGTKGLLDKTFQLFSY